MFETRDQYQRRQSYLDQSSAAQSARADYLRQQQAAAQPPGPFDGLGGLVGGVLDLLGRPAQAVRTGTSQALGARLAGQGLPEILGGFGQGALQGIQGQGPRSFAEVFQHQLGAPAGPQLGPWDTRGVAGFGMDLLTDPLGMIPTGKLGSAAGKIGSVLGATSTAAPYVRRGAEALDFAAEPFGRTLSSRIPGVEGVLNRFSPRLTATDQPFLDYLSRAAQVSDRARELSSSFMARRGLFEVDEVGRVALPDGNRVAWNDLFQNPYQTSRLPLSEEQYRYIKDMQDVYDDLHTSYQKWLERLRGSAPETADSKAFALESQQLGPGERFIAREYVLDRTGEIAHVRSPRARKGFQFEREFPTAEDALAAGYRSLGPVETLEYRVKQMGEKVNQIQYALALEPMATVRDVSRIPMAEAGIKSAQQMVTLANDLRQTVARASRGETIPTQTIERLRETFPEQVDQLLRIESRGVRDVPFAGLLQQGDGVTGLRSAPNEAEIGTLIARVAEHLKDVEQGITSSRQVLADLSVPTRKEGTLRLGGAEGNQFTMRTGLPNERLSGVAGPLQEAKGEAARAFGIEGAEQVRLELSSLLGLLQRAARGETIPAASLRPFGERYQAIVEPLSRFMSRTADSPPGAVSVGPVAARTTVSREQFNALAEQAKQLHREALDEAKRSRGIRKGIDTANAARVAGLTESPAWPGMFFSPEAADRIAANFGRTANPVVEGLGNLTGPLRAIQTGFDLGGMFLQGVPALARRPSEWLAAFGATVRAYADPDTLARYMAAPETQQVFREFPGLATAGVGREYFEAVTNPSHGLPQMLRQVPGVGPGILNVVGRSQAAFETGGVVLRAEWAKALRPLVEAAEAAGETGARAQAAQFLNHATGVVNRAGQGVSPTQQSWERLLLFAPGYTASAFATMGDVLGGRVAREEALKTLGSMLAVGVYGHTHLAQAMGQQPQLDPSDSRFMTVEVGGERVGIGSVWTALARTLGRIATAEPSELVSLDPTNPFVRFWRSRSSPTVSLAWDLILGETYVGEPFTQSPGEFAKRAAQTVLPFGIPATAEAAGRGGPAAAATAAASQFLGLREFPGTFADRREQVAQDRYGKEWAELDPYERVQAQQDPKLARELPNTPRFERDRNLRTAFDRYTTDVNAAAEQVAAGQITRQQFRQQVREAQAQRSANLDFIGDDPNRKPPTTQAEADRRAYLALFDAKDASGRPDFDAAEEYLATLPPSSRQYIEDTERAALGRLNPQAERLMNELKDARGKLKDYWAAQERGLARYKIDDEWEAASPAERFRIQHDPRHPLHGRYQAAARLTASLRERMRARDKAVDRALVEWYGRAPTGGYAANPRAAFG